MDEKNKRNVITIPKESAVFWLDKNGRWRNEHGEFEHKRIIEYFHASIRKDDGGYHLEQITENGREKVYFNYEDTALFVFDVIMDREITLVLNTKKRVRLNPRNLFVKGDCLYTAVEEERVKFVEKGLMKLSEYIEYDEDKDQFSIQVKGKKYPIHVLSGMIND